MDIERLEKIAYAEDRASALENLVPGTEDYYFHHCLHWQHQGDLERVDETLRAWIERHGRTTRAQAIERRQALLAYARDPRAALEHVQHSLYLRFDHQRTVEGESHDYPSALGERIRDRRALAERAYRQASDLSGFSSRANDWLLGESLDSKRRRHLLERLDWPAYPELVDHVAADLAEERTPGFGSLPIHGLLLPEQLDELCERVPGLREDAGLVGLRLRQLTPSPDIDWRRDEDEYQAYLDRLWAFVSTLSPVFNSLIVFVAYHRLDWQRRRGQYAREPFLAYLRLPKQAGYVPEEALYRVDRRHVAVFGAGHAQDLGLEPFADDDELVRDYLLHFLAEDEDTSAFAGSIREDLLRRLFATAKIMAGVGEPERWYALLDDPADYQRLSDRVDIEFGPQNPDWFAADADVRLSVWIKNVPTLVVKVFEINTRNHFFTHGRDVDTAVDLDGMVATHEYTHRYQEPSARRVLRWFEFPELSRPGVYVIELVGAGKSSRALIRKGGLRFVERPGAAGHVFTIMDERNQRLDDATLWLGGREYRPRADGTIVVPYSTAATRETILLCHGERATVETFEHRAERYRLLVGIYAEREQLLARNRAQVVIRPILQLAGVSVPIALLQEPRLAIEARDISGVRTHTETEIELFDERETVHEFQVPADLAEISFTVRGKVRSMSEQVDIELDVRSSYRLNSIDTTANTEDMHLSRYAGGYLIYVLGKSGETRAGKPINLSFFHRDFARSIDMTLQSDDRGCIDLGDLQDIARVVAKTPSGVHKTWNLERDACTYPQSVHALSDERIRLPYMAGDGPRQRVSLLEMREQPAGAAAVYVRDVSERVSVTGGYLEIEPLEPGDYRLALLPDGVRVTVRVTRGRMQGAWAAGESRLLEVRKRPGLHVTRASMDESDVVLHLSRVSQRARVHVVATRLVGERSLYGSLGTPRANEPSWVEIAAAESHYISGRDIGDEYRYILERRHDEPYPGNMLERPSVLLNPWSLRTTSTGVDHASEGGEYARKEAAKKRKAGRPPSAPKPQPLSTEGFANLDFLAQPARAWFNLRPEPEPQPQPEPEPEGDGGGGGGEGAFGVIRLPMSELAGAHLLRVLAVDGQGVVYREIGLPVSVHRHRDLRLLDPLPMDRYFGEKKQVAILAPGEHFTVEDIATTTLENYDTLGRVYRLFMALSGNSTLAEFRFVLDWTKLDQEEKRARYSEYACHELNLFISRKDPAFFCEVVKPYLESKLHKTFMDRYLLEEDLSRYLEPWAYGRLNIVERILLAGRISGESEPGARHIRDRFELVPPDIERENHLFQTALGGSALSTEDGLGFADAKGARRDLAFGERSGTFRTLTATRAMPRGGAGAPGAPPPPPAAAPAMAPAAAGFAAPEPESVVAMDKMEMDIDALEADEEALDMFAREQVRHLYRAPDTTREWAENNYYKLRIHEQGSDLIPINAFWRDFAEHDRNAPFWSRHIAYATSSFTEMMLALSVIDLPFDAAKHQVTYRQSSMQLSATSPCIVFHKQIKPVEPMQAPVPILVNQNYFRFDDRYEYQGNEQVEKYVTGELLVHVVYVCQVVLTNPTSSPQKLELLMQIPGGAVSVNNGFTTRSVNVTLGAHGTHAVEYAFYFPVAGEFSHYPVHVTKNEELVAASEPMTLTVVERLSRVDSTSWAYVSQHGDDQQVLDHLEAHNIERLDLELIAWRMREPAFYRRVIDLLTRRHVFHSTLWSYSVLHHERTDIAQYLAHQDGFLSALGPHFESSLVTVEPIERHIYEHLEYAPLVNARAHRLGDHVKILNQALDSQYRAFLRQLTYKPSLDADDCMAATYYLLLQDRVEAGLAMFDRIDAQQVSARLQYDYLSLFVSLYRGDIEGARMLAERHAEHPVHRWRKRFQAALAVIDEASGGTAVVVDEDDRAQVQARLAATDATFDFTVESRTVTITYQNLAQCRVNYYPMDIELLFSRQPFMQQQSERFSIIRPHTSELIELPAERSEYAFELPERYQSANIIVEVTATGRSKSQAYYANELLVKLADRYGQVRVHHRTTGAPVPRTYIKVYARMKDGDVSFYKDGYTDIRGCFDYASLSTNALDQVKRFALLIASQEYGALIREADPPKR